VAQASGAQEVRATLEAGNTVKAARLAEKALEAASAGGATAELRYLLLKAYVMDLQPEHGKLYKQTVGKADDGMERYQEHIETLEGAVRAEGEPALAQFPGLLDQGDDLDRLLVLGMLEDLAGDATWEDAAGSTRAAIEQAAGRAVMAAISDCAALEAVEPGADPRQDEYVQSLYSLLSGLTFLSHVDPALAAGAAATALECRSAAGRILTDRPQLERLGPDLAAPLHKALAGAVRADVQVDALILLGRFGRCDDLGLIREVESRGQGTVSAAAANARQRMQRRLDCAG
jgi:hypothetical protein